MKLYLDGKTQFSQIFPGFVFFLVCVCVGGGGGGGDKSPLLSPAVILWESFPIQKWLLFSQFHVF